MIGDEVRETVGSMISCIAIPVWTLKLEDEKNALVMAIYYWSSHMCHSELRKGRILQLLLLHPKAKQCR